MEPPKNNSDNKNFKNFNFVLDCGLFRAGFNDVSGLDSSIKNSKESHDLSKISSKQKSNIVEISQIMTLKRGLIVVETDFFEWLKNARGERRNLNLTLFGSGNNAVACWKILKALPIKLKFNASNDHSKLVEIEELDLEFENITLKIIKE